MDGDELAEDVAGADVEPRRLALVFQILRRQPDRGEREDLGAVADRGVAVDHRRRADPAVPADADMRTDDGERRRRRCRRRSTAVGDTCAAGSICAIGRTASSSSASATVCPSTSATADAFTSGPRGAPSVTTSCSDRRARPACGTSRRRRRAAARRTVAAAAVAARRRSSSSSVAACVSASIISTAGISGLSGKCPWKNSSLTVTFLTATSRFPGSCSATASTRSEGKRWASRSRVHLRDRARRTSRGPGVH